MLPLPVHREDVILFLRYRMARCPALGIVPLRRLIRQRARPERIGRGVLLKLRISPCAAIREPLGILHHEINVMESAGLAFYQVPCPMPWDRSIFNFRRPPSN